MIEPKCTKTFHLDIGRKCNAKCFFCYYHHLGDLSKQGFISHIECVKQIEAGLRRGCNYMDITGGEPTMYPGIESIIEYANSIGIRTCIITNGIVSENKLHSIINAGIDEFLVSIHGMKDTHNLITGVKNARYYQERFLENIMIESVKLRFNFVLNKLNQSEIVEVSKWMLKYNPSIVNFINFNPHDDWADDMESTKNVLADLRIVEKNLNEAIFILEDKGIGVNLRYYPMCRIKKDYRRTICSKLHVQFDPYEWDYGNSHDEKEVERLWQEVSKNYECKESPCNGCDLQNICGGINRTFLKASREIYGEIIEPVKDNTINKQDFYFYRQFNVKTLKER